MRLLKLVLLLVIIASLNSASVDAQADSRYFDQAGCTVQGRFLDYWQQHGGLAQFGYPLTDQFYEPVPSSDQLNAPLVQYFERGRFELHPENQPPHDVLLSLLGKERYSNKYPSGAADQLVSTNNPYYFAATGKTIGGSFRTYWETHGGLAVQGYPVSDEFIEVSEIDSKEYKVQYFERAVFEFHLDKLGTPYEVQLSLLGKLRYQDIYVERQPVTADLRSISLLSDDEGWAVGLDGAIVQLQRGRWKKTYTIPPSAGEPYNALLSVSAISSEDSWAVGQATSFRGITLRYKNGIWKAGKSDDLPVMNAVQMLSASEGWAVGWDSSGTIVHYKNSEWKIEATPSRYNLNALHMVSPNEGWVVGDRGIFHYHNGMWNEEFAAVKTALYSVKMLSSTEGWAVGEKGNILHYISGSWQSVPSPVSTNLFSVYMLSPSEGWAVGEHGSILHYMGEAWKLVESPTSKQLSSVQMTSSTTGWAVGRAGTILHYQNGVWSVYNF